MKTNILSITKILLATVALSLTGCDLDVVNPNGPTDAQVLSSRDGLITLSVGMRQFYSRSTLEAYILPQGTTARELRGITTFTTIIEIDQGGYQLPTNNARVLEAWLRSYQVMTMAEDILTNAPTVLASDPAMLSGIVAHAKLFKAMSLGGLALSFTHVAPNTDKSGQSGFITRDEALDQAIVLLEEAQQTLVTTAPSAEFGTLVTGASFNILNTVRAYLARFALINGDYAKAITAANSVNLTVASSFTFTTLSPNPLYNQLQVARNYAARDNFGLPAGLVEAGDGRIAFYFSPSATTFAGDPVDNATGFATSISSSIPVYLPDEMQLIIAEATVRSNGVLTDAVTRINNVRTQTTGDPFGVHAALPPYAGAVTPADLLTEIYKQRSAELYLSGLRWEDNRRFGRATTPTNVTPVPLSVERSRDYYPFPQQERQSNVNTPVDPAI